MVEQMKWVERTFEFSFPVGVYPCIVERLRGLPVRVEELVTTLPGPVLTRKVDAQWSIQEHIGHLFDLEELGEKRLADYAAGAETLTPADMQNQRTEKANHNARPIGEILGALRSARLELVRMLEQLGEQDVARSSIHPRLKKPMRLVDWCYFMAEHDDHHVARITALGRLLNRGNRRKVDLP